MRSRRTTELLLLMAAALPVLIVFALVDTSLSRDFTWMSLAVPASLLGSFVVAHLAVRRFAPAADPALLPLAFLLAGLGLAVVTRLDADLAASQVLWLFISVGALVATLVVVPSLENLARYKYTIMIAGIALLVAPVFIGREINGARLWIHFAGFSFQPGELAKIAIIVFLASYLAENREMLSISTRRFLGLRVTEPRTLGPLVLMWAISLFVLIFERDLGSSLLLFGIFLVMLYAATGRASYVVVGLVLFAGGATAAWRLFDHVQARVAIWLDPFADAADRGYQLVQSLFALAAGGLTGSGLGAGLPTRIPFVTTDFIFSAISEELGLLGAAAVIAAFLIFALRGLATASRARSDMAALVATGVVSALALQAFVIVGGVTRLIPLTGVTLPFMSYGGSSLLSTFIMLGLLLHAGNEGTGFESELQVTSTDLGTLGRFALGGRLVRIALVLVCLDVALVANLTSIQVVRARELTNSPANTRGLADQARQDRGSIVTRDGVVLAHSVADGRTTFKRAYPEGELAAHVVGYYSPRYGRAGIEAAANDILAGQRVLTSWNDVMDQALGRPIQGTDVVLTIDSTTQRAAEHALDGRTGAVVVLDPRTGAVLASASTPGYRPSSVEREWESLSTSSKAPLLDRSRQSLRAPGSTFKVVTLTGALESGTSKISSTYPGPARLEIGGAPVTNFEGGGYGSMTLAQATMRSVNTVFAQVAVDMGPQRLVKQAESFGFDTPIGYELPVKVSLMPKPGEMTTWETAWAGVGQPVGEHESPAGPQATVMQMALVAAGIANNGTVMTPYVIDHTRTRQGEDSPVARPRTLTEACSPLNADQVTAVMVDTVAKGSGARAAIRGIKVAGKTGTAEVSKDKPTDAWFIAFAPAEDPVVAVGILIEGGGVGGRVAAPAARPVLLAALAAQGVKR